MIFYFLLERAKMLLQHEFPPPCRKTAAILRYTHILHVILQKKSLKFTVAVNL